MSLLQACRNSPDCIGASHPNVRLPVCYLFQTNRSLAAKSRFLENVVWFGGGLASHSYFTRSKGSVRLPVVKTRGSIHTYFTRSKGSIEMSSEIPLLTIPVSEESS